MKSFIIIVIAVLTIVISSCSVEPPKDKLPNLIYILADDLGYGDVGAFNSQSKIATPHLDMLASEGMKFTDAHTSSSVCTPTRYGILTGRYNWRSRLKKGVLTGKSKALIPSGRTTVASMLQNAGYYTAFIGKWHLGWDWGLKDSVENNGEGWDKNDFDAIDYSKPITNTPNDLGFDYAYGHSGSLDMAPYVYVENGKVTALPDRSTVNSEKYSWWRQGPTGSDFIHEEVTPNFFNRANSYITERTNDADPFFLYLALPSPHTPILPTEEWMNKSNINPYADFVMMVDDYVGQLIESVQKAGIAENTIIIFTSDNGCSPEADFKVLADAGHDPSSIFRGHKADIYEGGHRVPFIVKWPDQVKKGSMSDQLICTTDLMATMAEIVGYNLQDYEGEDSYSFLSHLQMNSSGSDQRQDIIHHSINGSFAIRKDDWKLIMAPGSAGWSFPRPGRDKAVIDTLPPVQLYNLKDDPAESLNIKEVNVGRVDELKSLLVQYIKDGRSTAGPPQQNDSIDFEWNQIDFAMEE